MRKKMYVEVIEPKSIALTKKQDKWIITYVERDESGDNRQERAFFVDVKINPPREKFIVVRYEISKGDLNPVSVPITMRLDVFQILSV